MSSDGDDYTLEEERKVHVWDVADFSSTNAFRQYREFMTEGPLRADIEYKSEEPFQVRFEVILLIGAGLIFRIRCSPHIVARTRKQWSDHGVVWIPRYSHVVWGRVHRSFRTCEISTQRGHFCFRWKTSL